MLLFWLLCWQIVTVCVAQEILLISPARAFARLWALLGRAEFWGAVLQTCLRVLLGFFGALLCGGALAVLTARSRILFALFSPLMWIVRSTPVASFIILTLVWFYTGFIPAFIAFLMVLPLVWQNLSAGIGGVDRELLEMARVFRLSPLRRARYIYLPAILPYFTAAVTTGMGFAWKSVIAAEVIARPRQSMGGNIYNAKIYLEIPDLFAWTIAVVLLSLLLEKLTLLLARLLERLFLSAGKGEGQG